MSIDDETPAMWDAAARAARGYVEMDAETLSAKETQVGGDHYRSRAIEPIDYIMQNELSFAEGNVVKYITRHGSKNGAEDVRKAIHYCQFILEHTYNEGG